MQYIPLMDNSKDKASGIYGFRNIENGKWYIGQSINIIQRKQNHLSKLRSNTHKNTYFQHDYNEYKEDSFEFVILEMCENEMLSIREEAWIVYYNSLNRDFGYNVSNPLNPCGEEARKKISKALKGRKFTKEWLQKLSNAKKGKKHSPESIAKRALHMKGNQFRKGKIPTNAFKKGQAAPMRGRKFTEEHKAKLSYAAKNRKNP
jgi:group I intron endonuclease